MSHRPAAKTLFSTYRIVWGISSLGLVACTSAELEVPPTHPGHPRASSGQVARTQALTHVYALDAGPSPSGSPDEHVHHHHHGQATPAPESASRGASDPVAAAFTCPMHPEVVRPEPGKCPICGMDLVPKKDVK